MTWLLLLCGGMALAQAPVNLPQVAAYYGPAARGLGDALADHGFAVLGDKPSRDLFQAVSWAESEGLPVLITTDEMLYLWYSQHRAALQDVETRKLLPSLRGLVASLWAAYRRSPATAPPQEVVALATAVRLADMTATVPAELAAQVDAQVAKVTAGTAVEPYPGDDYTQYVPRGPYAATAALRQYFRLSKWLGRHLVPLAGPGASPETLRRAAWWCALLRRDADVYRAYRSLADTRRWLAGPCSAMTSDELNACLTAIGAKPEPLSDADCRRLSAEIVRPSHTPLAVRGRLVDPLAGQMPTHAFALLPEHGVPDARLFEELMDAGRQPSSLQLAASLGFARAAELVDAPVRPLVLASDSIYDQWLAVLPPLSETDPRAPRFMHSGPWRDKTLNTALTSYSHLKHNHTLYETEAGWLSGMMPRIPGAFVEPLPTFWHRFEALVTSFRSHLAQDGLLSAEADGWCTTLAREARLAAEDAERELAGQPAAHVEHWTHWSDVLRDLPREEVEVVAGLATTANGVVQIGTGGFYPMVAQFDLPGQPSVAAVGQVGSCYEFTEPDGARLDNKGWQARLRAAYAKPLPPDWTASFRLSPSDGDAAQRAVLRGAETDIGQHRTEQALASLRALGAAQRGNVWEVRAQVLIGRALEARGEIAAAKEAYLACERMYGCAEGRRAAADAQRIDVAQRKHELAAAHQAKAEALAAEVEVAATEARPGLTKAQESERGDRRLRALLRLSASADTWRLVAAECPDSPLLPAARLLCAMGLTTADLRGRTTLRVADSDEMKAVAREYRDSALGKSAAMLLAGNLAGTEDAAAFDLMAPYLDQRATAEPYQASCQWLAGMIEPGLWPVYVNRYDRVFILKALARRGDATNYLRLFGDEECNRFLEDRYDRTTCWTVWMARGEPRSLAAWAAVDWHGDDIRPALAAFVRECPRSAAAPEALAALASGGPDGTPDSRSFACHILGMGYLRRLAQDYPNTHYGLRAAAALAIRAGEYDRGRALLAKANELPEVPWLDPTEHDRHGECWFDDLDKTLDEARTYQPFVPGWPLARIVAACAEAWVKPDQANAVDDMVRAAGDQAPKLLQQMIDNGRDWMIPLRLRKPVVPHHFLDEEEAAQLVNAPGGEGQAEAVAKLTFTACYPDNDKELDNMRAKAECFAATHQGTPAAALMLTSCAELLLRADWPEQAMDVAKLAAAFASPFRERAQQVLDSAPARVVARRAGHGIPLHD